MTDNTRNSTYDHLRLAWQALAETVHNRRMQ